MTRRKRWMACFLTAVLLVTMAGCGNGGGNGQNETGGSAAVGGQGEQSENAGNEGTSEEQAGISEQTAPEGMQDLSSLRGNTNPTQEEIDLVNKTFNDSYLMEDPFADHNFTLGSDYSAYPVEEDVTLTVWMPLDSTVVSLFPSWNEHPVFKQIEKMTGINLEIISPALGEESTEFNLMLTDNELPDIIYPGSMYPGGVSAGVEDGFYLDMTDLIDQYMPNYKTLRESNEAYCKETTEDDGTVNAVYIAQPYSILEWYCLMIKQEALNKTGLPVPVTMDDWHEFLVACKNAGYTYPLVMDAFYGSYFTSVFSSAYGSYDWLFVNKDGKVDFGPGQEGTKEYLQTMRNWYEEGLINSDLVTGRLEDHIAYMVSEESASALLWMDYYDNEGIDYVVVPNPVLKEGDVSTSTQAPTYAGTTCASITTSCKNVEAACAFLDFGFSKKGWEIENYGAYGDVHLIDENGAPYYPENSPMYKDPDGLPNAYTKIKYRLMTFPNMRDDEQANPATTGNDHTLNNRLYLTETMDHSLGLPPVKLTVDEAQRADSIGVNISTSRQEYFTKIVTGQLPVDAWDDFMKEAKNMGLDELLAIYQAALDRYNAK